MKRQSIPLGVALACLMAGCAPLHQHRQASSDMDRSFRYVEVDHRGDHHDLSTIRVDRAKHSQAPQVETSGEAGAPGPITRVPAPALVDLDSTIEIQVDKTMLGSGGDGRFLTQEEKQLLEESERVSEALESLGMVVAKQEAAIKAYTSSATNFVTARQEFGEAEQAFLDRLYELWPEDSPDPEIRDLRLELEKAADATNSYEGIRRWLNGRLRALEDQYIAIEHKTKQQSLSLRLAAWLSGPGQDATPIHLEGYDTLDEGQIQFRDRWGLDLDAEERARLIAQVQASQRVADAANSVLRKEKSVGAALLEIAPAVSQDIGALATKVEALRQSFTTNPIPARLERIKTATEAVLTKVREDPTATAGVSNALAALPISIASVIETWNSEATAFLGTLTALIDLSRGWRNTTSGTLSARVDTTLSLVGRVRGDWERLRISVDPDETAEEFVVRSAESLSDEASLAIQGILESGEVAALTKELESFVQDAKAVKELVDSLGDLGKMIADTSTTLDNPTYVPEVLKVPLEDVEDTSIVLRRTGRRPGDTVTVKATRFQGTGEDEIETGHSTATFDLGHYGWYARLSPAVVLAKPESLTDGNDGFRFAPTLSWMHHYVPRPDKTGAGPEILRTLRMGAGIHAAFLSFESQSNASIQIGLGPTLSFWEDRLQFGGGYNLMSDGRDDGRFYYFVGTDLIGLLQTVGLVK